MQAKPVQIYKTPAYPTRLEVLADPRLLKENLPAAWRMVPQMAGVVALMLAVNACTAPDLKEHPRHAAIVAPIFQHGEGRGLVGCVIETPPVFLSEEEAMQVITEEMSRAGVEGWRRSVDFEGVNFSQYGIRSTIFGVKEGKLPGTAKPLNVDLQNDEHAIAIEFVSTEDYFVLGGFQEWNSLQDWDFQHIAQDVASEVQKLGPEVYFGTFYEPGVDVEYGPDSAWMEEQAKGKEQAKELLRQQVQDFIEWLQAQGVI